MHEILTKLIGKKVDLTCGGGSNLRGEVLKVEGGILYLNDSQQQKCYVSIDKIVAIWEADDEGHKAGFVSKL